MEKFVLDTNLFFNMEPGLGLGRKTEEVVKNVAKAIKAVREQTKAEFYMPPRIVAEFLSFFDDKEQNFIKDFLSVVVSKSPDINRVDFKSPVFYKLVEDIRERSYKGLNIAEEEMVKMAKLLNNSDKLSEIELQKKSGAVIKSLRNRYRQATRFGFLDSVADLDLITLAKELEGTLVSTDEGVVKWGRAFGTREMDASTFGNYLAKFL